MPDLLLYFLKVNLALAVLYCVYFMALRKLTFFGANRLYFWVVVVFSAIYPLVDYYWFTAQKAVYLPVLSSAAINWHPAIPASSQPETGVDWGQALLYLFWAGVAVMSIRLLSQFLSLYLLHRDSTPALHRQTPYQRAPQKISPFSFGDTIYMHPESFSPAELDLVVKHELVHVRQAHTLDVMLSELLTVFCWWNPLAWKMRQSIKENLEYLADQALVTTGVDQKRYQYSLLRAVSPSSLLVVHPFNAIPLKSRISMMNQPTSSPSQKLKFLLAFPLMAVLLLITGTESLSEIKITSPYLDQAPEQTAQATAPKEQKSRQVSRVEKQDAPKGQGNGKINSPVKRKDKPVLVQTTLTEGDFLRRNPTVDYLNQTKSSFSVVLKSGKIDAFPNTKAGIAAAEQKYGKLPAVPEAMPPLFNPPAKQNPSPQQQYNAFLKRNPSVKGLGWDKETLFVYLKNGKTESYPGTPEGVAQVEKKYGSLPVPPPPPPPAPSAPAAPAAALAPPPPPPLFRTDLPKEFLQRNPTVKGISWNKETIYVILKDNEVESFDNTPSGRAAFEKKYGTLPPPPPPVPAIGKLAPKPRLVRPLLQPLFHAKLPEKFKLRNPYVQNLYVNPNKHSLNVVLKDGKVESFDTTPVGLTAFERKFGPMPPPLVNPSNARH